jgi:pyruvate dehydrogenase E2 component (dihydrolipoamide acetyltransferase)
MVIEVVVPRLGWSMDEGTFGEWLKRDGDFVERGQALFVLEGEKSAQDIESFDEGILRIPSDAPQPGDTVKVGQVLAFLVAKGELAPFEHDSGSQTSATPQAPAKIESTTGNESSEAVVDAERHTRGTHATRVKASPRARRLAAQLKVDWKKVGGTGRTGRIRERDILASFAKSQVISATAETAPHADTSSGKSGAPRLLAVSPIRRTIASRMRDGAHETAPVTLTTRCDATNLVALRAQFRAAQTGSETVVPGYNDIIIKLAAAALLRHPLLAAQWNDRELVLPDGIHISLAVDTDAGLMAPVIRDADKLTLRQIAAETRRLAELARGGKLSADEMQGGVFTITNLGMFGIDAFTPIINLPQCAILGVGRIVREPAVVNDQIVPRDQLTLSLTFDHRIVDGAPAARFLQDLSRCIEQPGASLIA